MALLAGGIIAYPMNWWLVTHHLKHGMLTVGVNRAVTVRRPEAGATINSAKIPTMGTKNMMMSDTPAGKPAISAIVKAALISVAMFAAGIGLAVVYLRP